MVNHWFKRSKSIPFTPLIVVMLALLLAVACGSTAAPETTAPETTAPETTAKHGSGKHGSGKHGSGRVGPRHRDSCWWDSSRHVGSQTGSHSCPGPGLGLGSEGPPRQSNRDGTRLGQREV